MTFAFDFHPEAQAEFAADVDWYDAREAGVGGRFAEAVRAAIDAAVDDPAAWATWPGWDRQPVVRSKGVTGFPYLRSANSPQEVRPRPSIADDVPPCRERVFRRSDRVFRLQPTMTTNSRNPA